VGKTDDDVEEDPHEDDHDVGREHGAHVRNVARRTDGKRPPGRRALVALALGSILLSGSAGCGGGGSLNAEALKKEVEAVESLGVEGSLVAKGAAGAKTTTAFTRVHAEELAQTATEEATKLKSAKVLPGLQKKAREAAALSTRIAALLTKLGAKPGDRAVARDAAKRLDEAASSAGKLGEGL
jgi:hypothetical protein